MRILGIESSCDDTSVALLDCSEKGCFVLSEKTASQIEIHKKYGGVVPEIAGRMHAEKIVPLIEEVIKHENKPDVIAVTAGPGLITGLIVGVEAARTLSYAWNVPVVSVNHVEGHIYSVEIPNPNDQTPNDPQTQKFKRRNNLQSPVFNLRFPALALVASGGHTELILMKQRGEYERIGATKDDAAGECFDKVAKLLDLPYPGGPQISKLAEDGNPNAINFPRPMIKDDSLDFSFAGLKTSALYWLRDNPCVIATRPGRGSNPIRGALGNSMGSPHRSVAFGDLPPRDDTKKITIADFCASFEQAIVDVLISKTIRAAEKYKPKTIILAGGVSANNKLRSYLKKSIEQFLSNTKFQVPSSKYSMDNAAMIAVAGYYHAIKKDFTKWQNLQADPNKRIVKN